MSNVFPLLEGLRDHLAATVPGVTTCKIGLEANMTPADYPMIRIVPSGISDGQVIGRRQVEVLVYFGQPIHESTGGLEAEWSSLLTMEAAIIEAASATPSASFLYLSTVLDEDRIDAYKLLAIKARLIG